MADLFLKQAKQYSETRPSYPQELFEFITSNTPIHDLVWDVGTGSGQAVRSLAVIYKQVIGTDTSQNQLDFAPKLPNVQYKCTKSNMSLDEVKSDISPEGSIDLVTIAQALHWFDLPNFYQQVKFVLKKPHGVFAAWCYTWPKVNDAIDFVFGRFYTDAAPYWDPARKLVDDKYSSMDFPFEPVDGANHTGPLEFETEMSMDLDAYFTYIRSSSAYQTAREKGVELLRDDVIDEFKRAWNDDGNDQKIIKFSIHLRIGRVGNLN